MIDVKKFVIILILLVFSSTLLLAQIATHDGNWDLVFFDDFTTNTWSNWDRWKLSHPNQGGGYLAYMIECGSGVTHGDSEHQVYQRENCVLGDGELKLQSFYEGGVNATSMQCGDYDLPPNKICDSLHSSLFYTSGNIQTLTAYKYGYFEIRCMLPMHKGSFPAFWLYSASSGHYNEIDIFEYSNKVDSCAFHDRYSCGIYCDNNNAITNFGSIKRAKSTMVLPEEAEDLIYFYVYACEWMPDYVRWYVDGQVVNEYAVYDSIPHYEMVLKVNYAIDNYALYADNYPIWLGDDEMIIDYIKIYQLKTDCDVEVVIRDNQDLEDFQQTVKKSFLIEPTDEVAVPANDNIHMRVSERIVIKDGFTIPLGAKISFQVQSCPE